jgi:pyruvate kinase
MLSGESAVGKFPEEAVRMLARIASFTENHRPIASLSEHRQLLGQQAPATGSDRMASIVEHALDTVPCDAILAPTQTGTTARLISRAKPKVWIIAPSPSPAVCQGLAFSYGVHAVDLHGADDWRRSTASWLAKQGVKAKRVLLVAGPSPRNPQANQRIELMRLGSDKTKV